MLNKHGMPAQRFLDLGPWTKTTSYQLPSSQYIFIKCKYESIYKCITTSFLELDRTASYINGGQLATELAETMRKVFIQRLAQSSKSALDCEEDPVVLVTTLMRYTAQFL